MVTTSTVLLGLLDLKFEQYDPPQNFSKYCTLEGRNIAKGVNLHQPSLASMPGIKSYIFEWSTTGSRDFNKFSLKESVKVK